TTSGQGFEDRTETTQYDSKGRFKVSTANALNHVNFMEYDEGLGKLSQQTDPNGLITRWEFDQFGRAKRELRPDGTELQTEYVKVTNPSLPTANYIIRVIETAKPVAVSYYDLLGREVRSELEGFDGTKIFVDKEYNEKGNLVRVSEPYFEGESSRWSMSEYDALDRVIRITEPGNRIITQTYEGLTTSTTNSLNQTKSRTINHRGLLESTQDATGNITSYHYDSVGNIIEIIDPLGNHTTFQYDLAGRKISIDDPDSGVTNFIYNALGELVSQTNANNETIFFEYDRLGRMTIRTHQEGSEFWEYDTQLNGVGKIAGTSGLGGYREHYHYDDLGRINSIVKQIEGNQYLVSQHYDSFGRISSYTYPSGFMLNYVYNERGYLANITRGDTGASIWRPTGMNARGQIVQEVFGNGLTTTSQYNEDTGYLESRISGLIQNTSFQFDSIGNLRERRDLIVSMTEQFDYDNLNRLVESHVLEQDPVFVTYDALGNITTKSDVGNYAYNSIDGGPHAVTSITGAKSSVYTYDNVGNRLTSSDGQITYSSTGKPLVIEQGASRVEFSLNGEDQRIVERVLKSGSLLKKKVYAAPLYEEITSHGSTVQIHYIKGLEGLVAVFKKTVEVNTKPYRSLKQNKMKLEMNYIHLDHLGSLSLITNHFGEEVERLSFDSWGNRRDGFDWGITPSSSKYDRGFTGHEHLDEVSLIHMNGRVYDPVIGRFVSPDSLIESVDNLQALNPYSYVLNNPLSFTDPSGHFSFKKFWKKALKLGKTFVKMGINWAAFTIGNSIAGPFGGAFLSSAVNSMLQGASPGQAFGAGLRGIPMGLVRALVNSGIGDLTSGLGVIANAAGHAMGEAGMAAASGGDVRSAMLGGFATTFGGTFNFAFKDIPLGSLLTGGTVTALSGGKFLDGAMNASFQYLYNDMMHPGSSEQSPWNGVLGPGSSMNIYGAAASQFPAQSAVQSKAGTFWGDFGNVMGSFADNHPYYMAYMNGTAILIGGVEGAILLSGFKISSALSKASMLQGYSTSMMNNGLSGVLHHFLHDELHDSAQGLGMAIFKNAQTVRYLDGMYRSYGAVSQGTPPNLHGWGATNWKTGLH
ncbi:MAG: hypothetical protein KDD55_01180, partial [Bdellovibrionales bacterium]|nr:hypothetical protein [Bdellovibrionales bacterium]